MINFGAVVNVAHTVFGSPATHIDKDTLVETSISVVKVNPDQNFSFGVENRIVGTITVKIKAVDVVVVAGDTIVIDSVSYIVIGDPEKDSQSLLYTAYLDVL